jgi:hypothetical protein
LFSIGVSSCAHPNAIAFPPFFPFKIDVQAILFNILAVFFQYATGRKKKSPGILFIQGISSISLFCWFTA